MINYFYDTYALIEFVRENKKFKKYFEGIDGITTRLNLMELYYTMLKYEDKETSENVFESFLPICIDIETEEIKKAAEMKLDLNKKRKNISYVDALGYQIALTNNLKFLTGDKEFKNMKNVEFVK